MDDAIWVPYCLFAHPICRMGGLFWNLVFVGFSVDTLIVAVAPKPPAKHLRDDDEEEEEEEELVRVFSEYFWGAYGFYDIFGAPYNNPISLFL